MGNAEISTDHARELLQRERERIETALEDFDRDRRGAIEEMDSTPDQEEDAEVLEDESVDDTLAEQLRSELAALERAEARLAEGTYGVSVESGESIPAGRLEAIPWAERTAEEQSRREGRR